MRSTISWPPVNFNYHCTLHCTEHCTVHWNTVLYCTVHTILASFYGKETSLPHVNSSEQSHLAVCVQCSVQYSVQLHIHYNTPYIVQYSWLAVFNAIYMRQGGLFFIAKMPIQPVTLLSVFSAVYNIAFLNMYCKLYNMLYSTVFITVYSTVYSKVSSTL